MDFNFYLEIFKAIRPRQWIKNLAIFAPIVFTGQLFNIEALNLTFFAFLAFCFISSASYLINDILDIERDLLHPFKKLRPIASGKIKKWQAVIFALILFIIGIIISFQINLLFFGVAVFYSVLHLMYSLVFKHIPILDIIIIASAYFLRVLAGEAATGFFITIWLRLTVFSLSLFLAIGKRRCELTLMSSQKAEVISKARPTLGHYTEKLLDIYTAMFANSTWLAYSFYTFFDKPPTLRRIFGEFFNDVFPGLYSRRWLMITIPFVLYGIMRYMQLIYEKSQGESPEKVLLTDRPLLVSVLLWGITVVGVIYVLSI